MRNCLGASSTGCFENGYDALHTLDLDLGNESPDNVIVDFAEKENCVLVSKDTGFVESLLLKRRPPKLLLISTGNIANKQLESLLVNNLKAISAAFDKHCYVELNRTNVISHI
jgi:predicted nuclease of predicted toxin-antitoxin system